MKRFILFLCFFTSFLFAEYQIIYINGPSSTGKSTLIKALQEHLPEPYLHIGIDHIIPMMPEQINNWKGGFSEQGFCWQTEQDSEGNYIQRLHIGPFAQRICQTYRQIALTCARQGHKFIIDDVALGNTFVTEWKNLLQDYTVLFIGVTAPLEVIENREKARGNRMIGSARGQYSVVHQGVTYDLFLNTYTNTLAQNVEKILSKLVCKDD